MRLLRTIDEVREWRRALQARGSTLALVPTMGYLHAGHLSLVSEGRDQADAVAMSIFVNPLQFGPSEDLDRYPRDLERDLRLAEDAGVEAVFAPERDEMYPGGEPWVMVVPVRGADTLCGAARPGHFRGVLTVVAKLFGIFGPEVAVFGRKDFQQLVLVQRMVQDLSLPVGIVGAPIVREPDGLAMSSRNSYLSPDERERALAISRALHQCRELFERGEVDPEPYLAAMRAIDGHGVALEYGQVVDPATLRPVERVSAGAVCAVAARVGTTRLIDNLALGS